MSNCNATRLWLEFLAASRYAGTPFTANWLNITLERAIHILGPQKHMLIPSVFSLVMTQPHFVHLLLDKPFPNSVETSHVDGSRPLSS